MTINISPQGTILCQFDVCGPANDQGFGPRCQRLRDQGIDLVEDALARVGIHRVKTTTPGFECQVTTCAGPATATAVIEHSGLVVAVDVCPVCETKL